MKLLLNTHEQTSMAGASLAKLLLPRVIERTQGSVVFLRGPLGAGKSTLVRGLLSEAGVTGVMPSPTYSLVESYPLSDCTVFHIDAYRLGDAAELEYLGLESAFETRALVLVEWPDTIAQELPKPVLEITLGYASPDPKTAGLGDVDPTQVGRTIELVVGAGGGSAFESLVDYGKWRQFKRLST